MTKEKKEAYETHESLRKIIVGLKGRKFKLFCGHHVSFGYSLGNNIHISNGKRPVAEPTSSRVMLVECLEIPVV